MRVLFTTLPAYGAFQPLAPVALALKAADHEVAFAASATFCRVITAAGFRCVPAGVDWSFDEREEVYARVRDALGPHASAFSPLRDVFAGFLPTQMVRDLLRIAREWPFGVLVRERLEFGGAWRPRCWIYHT